MSKTSKKLDNRKPGEPGFKWIDDAKAARGMRRILRTRLRQIAAFPETEIDQPEGEALEGFSLIPGLFRAKLSGTRPKGRLSRTDSIAPCSSSNCWYWRAWAQMIRLVLSKSGIARKV